MSNKDLNNYLTIGELAALYNIPKQTLIYYATNGIIEPAFVNEKGYRYYSVNEFLILEIILNLRKLDVKTSAIKDFVFNRDTEKIVDILNDTKQHFREKIAELSNAIDSIDNFLNSVDQQSQLICDCFQTLQLPTLPIVTSPPFDENSSQSHLPEFAEHNQRIFPKNTFRSAPTGWIVSQENFFVKDSPYHSTQYFTPLPPNCQLPAQAERPAGLYVLINFSGSYFSNCRNIRTRLNNYLQCNNLQPVGDIYILPLKNHWQAKNSKDFITQLTIKVSPPDK